MPGGGRVTGKIGVFSSGGDGHSYSSFNEEIIWISIGMSVIIGVLIMVALCYLACQKYKKRRQQARDDT